MKKCLFLICMLIAELGIRAQSQIEIAVAIPSQQVEISKNTYNVMRSKLLGAMTKNGVASVEYSSIIIYPEISFTDKQVVEGGMRNVTIINMQLNLIVEHLITGTIFNSLVLSLQGEGISLDQAVMRAVSKLNPDDARINEFVSLSKQKIISYYENNTNAIIQKARNLASTKQYEEAVALLFSYPASVHGYATVSAAMSNIYKQYQSSECGKIVQEARAAYSVGNYSEAATLLQQVDMQSSCANEARTLCQQIKNTRDAEAARRIAAYERAYQSQVALEKHRINAIRDVAVAYCKSRPKYYYIF